MQKHHQQNASVMSNKQDIKLPWCLKNICLLSLLVNSEIISLQSRNLALGTFLIRMGAQEENRSTALQQHTPVIRIEACDD